MFTSASVGPDSCLGTRTSIGVHYKSCNKPLKKQAQYPRNCKEVHKNGRYLQNNIYEVVFTLYLMNELM